MRRNVRLNPELKLDRILGLFAHYVRNDARSESMQAQALIARMLSQHTPDEVVQAIGAGWRANSGFPGALEKFQVIWREITNSRPEFSGRSLKEALDAAGDPEEEAPRHDATGAPPPWARHSRVRRGARPGTTGAPSVPMWQPDPRAGGRIDEKAGFADKNYCLRAIFERTAEDMMSGSPLLLTTFWTFDGVFGRGHLTAFASDGALGYGGEVAEAWVATGDQPAKAVFASVAGVPGKALLVRLVGVDMADLNDGFWLDYSGNTPWDDKAFTKSAATLVALAEEKLGRGAPGRPRRISGSFYCGECQRSIPLKDGLMPAACPFCDDDLQAFRDLPAEVGLVESRFEKAWKSKRNGRSRFRRT